MCIMVDLGKAILREAMIIVAMLTFGCQNHLLRHAVMAENLTIEHFLDYLSLPLVNTLRGQKNCFKLKGHGKLESLYCVGDSGNISRIAAKTFGSKTFYSS